MVRRVTVLRVSWRRHVGVDLVALTAGGGDVLDVVGVAVPERLVVGHGRGGDGSRGHVVAVVAQDLGGGVGVCLGPRWGACK